MDIQQLMQILQQNPQLLIQMIEMLVQAGLVVPGPKMQQAGPPAPAGPAGPPMPGPGGLVPGGLMK